MDALRLLAHVLWGTLTSPIRRLVRGPRHPDWTWRMEMYVGALRSSFAQIARMGAIRYRAASEALSPQLTGGAPCRAVDGGAGHWIEPPDADDRAIVYLHGGGYCFGSIRTHGNVAGHLALAANARCFFPAYPLAPEHPLPAARDHVVEAIRALYDQGVAPSRLAVAGDSAGGNLVFLVLMALRDAGLPLPAAGVAISPWTDLSNSGASFQTRAERDYCTLEACTEAARHALAGADGRDPAISPLYADLRGLPPILVHAGGAECLVDQITALGDRAAEQGADVQVVVYPAMVHVWHMLVGSIPEADRAIEEVASWIRQHT